MKTYKITFEARHTGIVEANSQAEAVALFNDGQVETDFNEMTSQAEAILIG